MDEEIESLFPLRENAVENEFYGRLRDQFLLEAESIYSEVDQSKKEKAKELVMNLIKPQSWAGPNGVEAQLVKGYEEALFMVRKHGNTDPETTIEYLQAIESLTKK